MDDAKKDSLYRLLGILGLVLLLTATYLVHKDRDIAVPSGKHDHADPSQHGHDIFAKPLESKEKELVPSGELRGGSRIVQYEAFKFGFSPDPLVVKSGENIILKVKSRDAAHGMMIPEIDFSADIPQGKEKEVSFKAPIKPGSYPVFCSVFCGSGHGEMKGTLVVLLAGDESHE